MSRCTLSCSKKFFLAGSFLQCNADVSVLLISSFFRFSYSMNFLNYLQKELAVAVLVLGYFLCVAFSWIS